ncbi:ribonuclease H-like domain-containing protein [Tanacetum coccineum]
MELDLTKDYDADEVPTNMALMAFSDSEEFQQPEFEGYGPKISKSVSEYISNEIRESPDAPLVKELVSNDNLEKKSAFPTIAKIEFVRPKQQEKPVRKPVNFDHVQANCNYHQRERVVSGNNYTRVNYNYFAKKAHPSAHMNMVPRAVLMKTGLRSLNTARPVNTAHPKTTVYSARPMSHFSKSTQSTVKRPYQTITTLTNKNFSQKDNTAKGKFYTARPNSAVVNDVRTNHVNAGHPQKEDQGYINSGCSRHMTGNMSYLSDFKEFDGGYVTFGGGAKGEKITGKGTLKAGKLDFEDVYFVKELQFNLFSVSQMCDKKNSVLFTNTGCFVLSPDFKLTNESQVLLKVLRKNNMYSIDIKNIVPKESLTCLVTKAILDESMLWHRRLGHVNFKTINKLVKENIVRGLPTKRFENDQTYRSLIYWKGQPKLGLWYPKDSPFDLEAYTDSDYAGASLDRKSTIGEEETTKKIMQIKERLMKARDRQKSYADKRRKPLEFNVNDHVLLKVSPWKGVVRFGKKGKLAPRYVGPFEIVERVGPVAYRLRLPQELSSIHDTFHLSNLKKCLDDASLQVPLEEIEIDDKLHFVEEPVKIMDREVKKLKRKRIPIVKVRWNSKRGAEFTWEREDQFKAKYPHFSPPPRLLQSPVEL